MDPREQEIDQLLAALSAAVPGTGMEDRVLARLAQLPAEEMPSVPATQVRWGWAVTLASACLLLLSVSLGHRHPAAMTAVAARHEPANVAPRIATSKAARKDRLQERPPVPLVAVAVPLTAPPARADRGLADLPSMLAPPESTTKQERLLSSIVHGPKRDEFALLNPAVQELVAQRREAEFTQFFPPPTPQEIYLAEHLPN